MITPMRYLLLVIIMAFVSAMMITVKVATQPDCNDPETWTTERGVAHCAVNVNER